MPSGVLIALLLALGMTAAALAILVRMLYKYPLTITIVKKNLDLSAMTEKAAGQAYLDRIRDAKAGRE